MSSQSKKLPRKDKQFRELLGLIGGEKKKIDVEEVNFHKVNVLAQPRKTFDDIPNLALNIARLGLEEPPIVAYFDEEKCTQHLDIVNKLWDESRKVSDLKFVKENGKKYYYILIAGERRLRSLYYLWEEGCYFCREGLEKSETLKEGECFLTHFESSRVNMSVKRDVNPISALFTQLSENIHKPVKPEEEAEAHYRFFRLIREIDSDFPLSRYAAFAGRSASTIRDALKFCELPDFVQGSVRKGRIAYGIALSLYRLFEAGVSEFNLKQWMNRAIIKNVRVEDFEETIKNYLEERNTNQESLFGELSEDEEARSLMDGNRKIAAEETILSFWMTFHHMMRILELFEEGLLGKNDSPYSYYHPLKAFRSNLDLMEKTYPHLENLLPLKEVRRVEEVIPEIRELVEKMEKEMKKMMNKNGEE